MTHSSGSPNSATGTGVTPDRDRPRWLKIVGLIGIVALVVIFITMLVSGGHGPSRHMR